MSEADLFKKIEAIENNNNLIEVLELEPPLDWIKTHESFPDHKYLPIEKTMLLLRKIFGLNFKIEVINSNELFNAVGVTVRVHYLDFGSPRVWHSQDGTASDAPSKIDKLTFAEFAVSSSFPVAKSLAINNALRSTFPLFGLNLNNGKVQVKEPKKLADKKLEELKEEYKKKKKKITFEEQLHIERIIEGEEQIDYQKIIDELKAIK